MPGTRGRKNPSLLSAAPRREAPSLVYVATGRPLKVGEYELPEGVEVPGAAEWPRVEAWIGARRIRPAAPKEKYVRFEDFTKAVDAERKAVADAAAAVEAELAEHIAAEALKGADTEEE